MKIYKTDTIGFCFGVKRAYEETVKLLDTSIEPIYIYGELIHNSDILNELSQKGAVTVQNTDDIPDGSTVIIRAHGVPTAIIDELNAKNNKVIDLTCPKVSKIHKIAFSSDNLIVAGNINHPEVIGIIGDAKNKTYVIKDCEEFCEFLSDIDSHKKYTLVAQTTFLTSEWLRIIKEARKYGNIEIINTICNSTEIRQNEVGELSKKVDLFVIVGSEMSSNTKKLHDIATKNCKTIYHGELNQLSNGIGIYEKIGLSSGASTPESAVEEVINNMNTEKGNKNLIEEEDVNFLDVIEESIRTIRNGQKVTGIVSAINGTEVQVDLGVKHAGFIPAAEFEGDDKPLAIGDEIEAFVVKVNDAEGTALLSKKNLDIAAGFEKVSAAKESGSIVKGKVIEAVKGGLVLLVNKIRVFVPASQASLRRDANLEEFVGKEVNLRILEVEDDKSGKRKRIIGSIRSVLREEKQKASDALWGDIAVGNKYEGTVKSLTDFGAFVDIGGADGLVHVTDMSWEKINKPADLLKIGQKVDVTVKAINAETKKISLTMKNEDENPWKIIVNQLKVGDVIDSTVLKVMPYGAFVTVIKGIDGLVHISQIATKRIAKVSDVLEAGQQIRAKITELDPEKKRVSLSIRALEEDAEPAAEENEAAVSEN